MFSVELISKNKRVIGLTWQGTVSPEEVRSANQAIEILHQQINAPFDLLVNMVNLAVFTQETQKVIAEHQRWLLRLGMKRAAVAVGEKAITKLQLKRTAKESGHQTEYHFATVQEAKSFLGF